MSTTKESIDIKNPLTHKSRILHQITKYFGFRSNYVSNFWFDIYLQFPKAIMLEIKLDMDKHIINDIRV